MQITSDSSAFNVNISVIEWEENKTEGQRSKIKAASFNGKESIIFVT